MTAEKIQKDVAAISGDIYKASRERNLPKSLMLQLFKKRSKAFSHWFRYKLWKLYTLQFGSTDLLSGL